MVTKKHQNVKRFCKKRFLACTRRFLLPAALRQRDLKGDDAAFVVSADAPVMAGHNGLGGGQSDAAPAGRAGTGGVRTVKAVKIARQLRGIYSGTGVRERQLYTFSPRKECKVDRSARVTVFHSIVQQDRQQAGDIVRHAADTQTGGDLRRQFFSGGLGKGTEIFDAAIRQFAERYGCDGRRRQSLLAACQLHEIFDKAVHGRQLAGMSKSGTNIAYGYDSDGKRITKTVNGTTYNYHYLGDQLVELTWGGNRMHFTYDEIGPASVNCNGTEYFYVKNAQGDVTGLVTTSGTRVVTYTYDAWGNPLSTTGSMAATLGEQNPLRYRGYVYDTETGLYYLQSRYYNPGWGRFINADGYASTGQGIIGNNMFAYCGNNPVKHLDPQGTFFKEIGVFFKRVLSNLKRNFTMKANVSRVYNRKTIYFGGLITVERGTTVKTTTSPNRKMQKQPTIYSDVDRSDPSDSSVGITIPRMNSEFDIHLGVSDTGITHSYNMGETVMGSGCTKSAPSSKKFWDYTRQAAHMHHIT